MTDIPHAEIRLTLTGAISTLNNLASKYETIYQDQLTTALNKTQNDNYGTTGDIFEESEIISYKLNNIYWLIDLINESPWFNRKHKLHSGAK